jgi:hypothetical protein
MGYPKSRPAFPPPGFNESVCALPSAVGTCAEKIGKEILNSHYANAHDFILFSVVDIFNLLNCRHLVLIIIIE